MTQEALDIHGHCLCGAISVHIAKPLDDILFCHCSQCRKTAGAPFGTVFPIHSSSVRIDDPKQCRREYFASEGKARVFCGQCGAPIYSQRAGQDVLRLRAGLFEQLPRARFGGHIFMASPARWYDDCDALPRYDELEPARQHLRGS